MWLMNKTDNSNELDDKEREFMNLCEKNTLGPWKCGLRAMAGSNSSTVVFATTFTEEEAKKYMLLRERRNNGTIPHRITQEVGWWREIDCSREVIMQPGASIEFGEVHVSTMHGATVRLFNGIIFVERGRVAITFNEPINGDSQANRPLIFYLHR